MSRELAWLESLQGSGIRPGLSRMRAILKAGSNPHRQIPAVIVAGTNGKGSVAATLASITVAAGIRTGLYTSPHLISMRERWRIDDEDVSAAALRSAIRELQAAAASAAIHPTYFEALTLVAFFLFRRSDCDLSILEVGMGGRLDATNVVRPLLSIITSVGLDHCEYLGETIGRIATEKAGVIHRGAVALTTVRSTEAQRAIARRAHQVDVPVRWVCEDTLVLPHGARVVEVKTPRETYRIRPRLAGRHQHDNLALAVRAAEELGQWFRIPPAAIRRGAETVRWGGRLEELDAGGRRVIVDGAHNLDGVRALVSFLREAYPGPVDLLFAVMKDKDWREMLQELAPAAAALWVTQADDERGEDPARLVSFARGIGMDATAVVQPRQALRAALRKTPRRPLVIAGSLYLAGEVLPYLRRTTARNTIARSVQLTAQESDVSPAMRPKRRTTT